MRCPKCKARMKKEKVRLAYDGYEERDLRIVRVKKVAKYDKHTCPKCGHVVTSGK